MQYTWDFWIFLKPSLTGEGAYWQTLARGLGWTLLLSLLCWAAGLCLALVIGVARTLPQRWLCGPAQAYIHVFRNIPLLVQVFLWYHVVPDLLPQDWGDAVKGMDPTLNAFATLVVALSLYTAAKAAELLRSGIQAVPPGQLAAARSLGLSTAQAYRDVLLPQALRIALPPLTSDFLNVFKNSAVALTIGLLELTGRSRQMSEFSAQPFETFLAATLLYMAITLAVMRGMRALERRLAIPGFGA
jgi:glutamate/aspartate transport system permease protein